MKRVIVRLGNGLGNQLFTYAAAYSFAKKNNADLFVDDESGFYKRNKYELHNLNISAPIVEKKYKFVGIQGRIRRKILKKLNVYKKNKIFLIEKFDKGKITYFNPNIFNDNYDDTVYFEGYFQSEKYFKEEKHNLKKELTFKNNVINQSSLYLDLIKNSNSVSIHLRQKKFLPSENHKNLDKLNSEFYNNNVEIIKKGVNFFDNTLEKPKYFVWSNTFDGLEKIFPNKKYTLVNENIEKDPAYDLFLMSQCKHFIMSPSTLHYWAAYLSVNSNKICLAPKNIKNISGYYGFSNNKDIKADWWKEI